jgi:GT2 family glycosyltransferase
MARPSLACPAGCGRAISMSELDPSTRSTTAVIDRLLEEISPKRVLDLASRVPLAEALRSRGVDALRLDVASPTPDLDRRYDLVVSLGALDNLDEGARAALAARICAAAPDVILAVDNFRSRWVELLATNGLFLDVDYDATFIAPRAMRFRAIEPREPGRTPNPLVSAEEVERLRRAVEEKDQLILKLNFSILSMQSSVMWKASARLRSALRRLLRAESQSTPLYWALRRIGQVWLEEGLGSVLQRARHKMRLALSGHGIRLRARGKDPEEDLNLQYEVWLQLHRLTDSDLERMRLAARHLPYRPLISILTPVYETDEFLLRRAIDSVRAQTYEYWQLCLVNDGSRKPHVMALLDEYAAIDSRITVEHLPDNRGIAEASACALGMANGEFVGLLDHDDELSPDALFEVAKLVGQNRDMDLIYSDEDKIEPTGRRLEPFFKPDWSPDLLLSMNYITHFVVVRRSLLIESGGFRSGYDGSQDYDLLLRVTERSSRIAHIPKVLYHWRKAGGSVAVSPHWKSHAHEAGRHALEDAMQRRGSAASVDGFDAGRYRIRYKLEGAPLVSIIIPTRDALSLLQQCVQSLEHKTAYGRYELIILDNESRDPATMKYLEAVALTHQVHRVPGKFNFSTINNLGASRANGDFLLFLNNDVQVLERGWLGAMLEQAQRSEVGAVGAKLLYPDGRIQHAGIVLGLLGGTGHAFRFQRPDEPGYHSFSDVVRNCSAVTGACLMIRRQVFEDIGGFDPRFREAYNDVDLCLRLRQRGYLIIYTPFAVLYHHESATRGTLFPPEEDELYWRLWGPRTSAGDPYYNVNLTRAREDWTLDLNRRGPR